MNKPTLLARMFGRSKHPVVSDLAAAALNQPLMISQDIGERLIGGYLSGTITSADSSCCVSYMAAGGGGTSGQDTSTSKRIAVVNVSGALVNRPMPGPSGAGPANYAALSDTIDDLAADDSVSAIVIRLESPGGMVSGCFDLTDRIFEARQQKPIHALVDDYAASAAYAIAAACDEIWVSRTGKVGSVGVVGFHFDSSAANAMAGLKVTAIHAGAKKVDFNPNFALTYEAWGESLAHVESIYDMFVDSVAKYRGIAAEDVRATEAGLFMGEAAIEKQLATKLGTWRDLMLHLQEEHSKKVEEAETAIDARPAEQAGSTSVDVINDDEAVAANDVIDVDAIAPSSLAEARVAVLDVARSSGLSSDLILQIPVTEGTDVREAVAHAIAINSLCKTAKLSHMAGQFIRNQTPIDDVRTDLIEAKAKADEAAQVVTVLPAAGAAKPSANPLDPNLIYQNRGKKNV